MGSKKVLAPDIARFIHRAHPKDGVLDVFAGTCAVASELASQHQVVANDIHFFAGVIARALFVATAHPPTSLLARRHLTAAYYRNRNALLDALGKQVGIEESLLARMESAGCWRKFLEFNQGQLARKYPTGVKGLPSLASCRQDTKTFPYSLFSRYFANSYFGLRQAVEIDSLRYAVDQAPSRFRDYYLAALISACSHCAAAPGHFAQFLVPRNKRTSKYVARIRSRSVYGRFMGALDSFARPRSAFRSSNHVYCQDAIQLLQSKEDQYAGGGIVIYADPPYSRAQYSRYYHLLETLTVEYFSLLRKVQTKYGRSKLGYLVTTDVFTSGVLREMIRESKDDTLIVLVDGKRLPQIWRDGTSISDNVEQITLNAPIKEST